jgi:hypothetical protein
MTHTYVAKSMISAKRDFGGIFIETQMLPRSSNWYTLKELLGRTGTLRVLTRTFLKDCFAYRVSTRSFFFPGGCHVYPHLDEVPEID